MHNRIVTIILIAWIFFLVLYIAANRQGLFCSYRVGDEFTIPALNILTAFTCVYAD